MEVYLDPKFEQQVVQLAAREHERPQRILERALTSYSAAKYAAADRKLAYLATTALLAPWLILDHFGVREMSVLSTFWLLGCLTVFAWASCGDPIGDEFDTQKRRDNRRVWVVTAVPVEAFYFLVLLGRDCGGCGLTPRAAFTFVGEGVLWAVAGMTALVVGSALLVSIGSSVFGRRRRNATSISPNRPTA
jgi:hypothetical protein